MRRLSFADNAVFLLAINPVFNCWGQKSSTAYMVLRWSCQSFGKKLTQRRSDNELSELDSTNLQLN